MDLEPEYSFYLGPEKTYRCRFTVQGSRFIGTLAPASSEKAAQEWLAGLKSEFPDATHHACAYRLGFGSTVIERSDDDGEPAGSAGAPMLQVLRGRNISDAIVAGTRYFGGTKLGLGGLTRAYRDCARLSLEEAVLKKKEPLDLLSLKFNYEDLGQVTRLVESLEGRIVEAGYSDFVDLQVKLPARQAQQLIEGFESACRGRGRWTKL